MKITIDVPDIVETPPVPKPEPLPEPPYPPFPPPSVKLGVVKEDQHSSSWNYKVRDVAPNPAVNRTGEIGDPTSFRRSRFNKAWQFFWADLLAMRVHGRLLSELSSTDRKGIVDLFTILGDKDLFLTNRFGTDNCNNYVAGIMRSEDPQIDPLICAGSVVEILEEKISNIGSTQGQLMARLSSFRIVHSPPKVTMETLNDHRVLRATIIEKNGDVDDFPQLYKRYPNLESHWVPYPYISDQDVWFPSKDLVYLKA